MRPTRLFERVAPLTATLIAAWTTGAMLAGTVRPAHAAKADVYALVGAKVAPVSGPALENATVILRDGVIEAVGTRVTVPPDARVIDAKGLTITPGLIDAFGGLGLPVTRGPAPGGDGPPAPGGPPAAPAVPQVNPLQPQAQAIDRVRPAEALRARDQGLTTALAIGREGVLPGRSVLLTLATRTEQSGTAARAPGSAWEMAMRQPAAMHLHMTSSGRGYPASLMGTMAHVRQQLLDATRYRDEWMLYERSPTGRKRPRFDAALAAWRDVLEGKLPLVVTAPRENDVRRAYGLADEFKIRIALAGVSRASAMVPLLKQRPVPLLVSVNFDPPRAALGGGGDEEREKRDIDDATRNPAALHKAGVPFALVSGYAPSFIAGVRKAIEAGLPRDAALRALTLDAARALGVADRIGSLEPGKLANVVLWSGEPLDRRAQVKMVFVDGELYEPAPRPERPRGDDGEDAPRPEPTDADLSEQAGEQASEQTSEETRP
jgi:imidazolonepropionase-like amidohydrolase